VETYHYQRISGYTEWDRESAFRAARKAVELDDQDSRAQRRMKMRDGLLRPTR